MRKKEKDIASEDTSYGYIKEDKIFRKGFLEHKDLEIGIVKGSPEESIKYFESKFELLKTKIQSLFVEIEKAENKGSYLQKLLHIKDTLHEYIGLGDFESIYKQLTEKENNLLESVGKNRKKNFTQKQTILKELEVEKASSDWLNAGEKIKDIKNKWIRIGPVEKEQELTLETQFQAYLEEFYKRRQVFFDERNALIRQRLEKYKAFAIRAEELLHATDMKMAIPEMKKLVEYWKNIGKVPKAELEPHITKFKSSKKAFFKKISDYKRNKRFAPVLSIPEKIQAFIKLNEELVRILDQMPPDGEDLIKRLQDKWKKVGFVPNSQEYKQLEYIFRTNSQKTIDSYYLKKTAIRTDPDYVRMPLHQQLKFQIALLKEFIQRDSSQIDNFENSFNRIDYAKNQQDDLFDKKLLSLKRALIVKQSLLKDLESKLSNK